MASKKSSDITPVIILVVAGVAGFMAYRQSRLKAQTVAPAPVPSAATPAPVPSVPTPAPTLPPTVSNTVTTGGILPLAPLPVATGPSEIKPVQPKYELENVNPVPSVPSVPVADRPPPLFAPVVAAVLPSGPNVITADFSAPTSTAPYPFFQDGAAGREVLDVMPRNPRWRNEDI